MYQPRRISRSEFVPIRQLSCHVRVWGEPAPGKVPMVLVHGWMDVAASWQFAVDALAGEHYIVAPDWRGYGLTSGPPADQYWFADYLADLDLLLDHYAPDTPVHLVGHSMGGNIAMMYAGVRPARVRRLVNLEGFGLAATRAAQAPGRYAKWIDEIKAFHRGEKDLRAYPSADAVAQRLMKTNRRLPSDKAQWLARQWAREQDDGSWHLLADPAHKLTGALLYRVDEALETYRRITAPTLWVQASDDSLAQWWGDSFTLPEFHERLQAVADLRKTLVADAGHMLHHDQPDAVAHLLETFLAD